MPGECSMLISLCLETDKIYSDKQIITDIPETWLIPEKNHSARNIYPTIFLLLIVDLIRLM